MGSNDSMGDVPDDIVDLEEFFAAGKAVPKGKKYRLRIDKEKYVVDVDHLTGQQILALAGKTPQKYLLRQLVRGAIVPIDPLQNVSLLAPGVERFMTIPNEVTEGDGASARKQFGLLDGDARFLSSLGLRWECVRDGGGVNAVIIYGWPLPKGYCVTHADVHVRLSPGYPDAQIDMAYFFPPLARADGKGINALSLTPFDGRNWQQWSRHRVQSSAWRPGIDDLATHMALVDDWLRSELRK